MRRSLVLLVAVGALAMAAGAQATTTVQKMTFDADVMLCNGDALHLSGPLLAVIGQTQTPSGGEVLTFHFSPQGVSAIDENTGTVFHATGLTRDVSITTPPGGYTETFVNDFHIQASRGAQNYIVREVFHVTVTPDGTVTVLLDKLFTTC